MLVAVGSSNPVEVDATRQAFADAWPAAQVDVEAVGVASGVAAQPLSDLECLEGARNRAILARETLASDYGVGIEAGLVHVGGLWFSCGWAVVVDSRYREGIGSTVRVPVPTALVHGIEHGAELDTVLDDDAQDAGYFGRVTGGVVSRGRATADAVVAALARFSHPTLFDGP